MADYVIIHTIGRAYRVNKTITKKVLKIANENLQKKISISEVELDLSQLGLDSITFIRIVVSLEETFEIEVPDEYLMVAAMNTITKMVDVVTTEIEKKAK